MKPILIILLGFVLVSLTGCAVFQSPPDKQDKPTPSSGVDQGEYPNNTMSR
jgi:hypothetical protein